MGNPDIEGILKTIALLSVAIISLSVIAWLIMAVSEFIKFVSWVGEKISWIAANPIPSAVAALIICAIVYVIRREYYE